MGEAPDALEWAAGARGCPSGREPVEGDSAEPDTDHADQSEDGGDGGESAAVGEGVDDGWEHAEGNDGLDGRPLGNESTAVPVSDSGGRFRPMATLSTTLAIRPPITAVG